MTEPAKNGLTWDERWQSANVLVVLNPDGLVEVYTSPNVRVKIVNRLATTDHLATLLADEYLMRCLPKWAQAIFFPWRLKKLGNFERVTPDTELNRAIRRDLITVAQHHPNSR